MDGRKLRLDVRSEQAVSNGRLLSRQGIRRGAPEVGNEGMRGTGCRRIGKVMRGGSEAAAVALAMMLLGGVVRGQAMGKAEVDPVAPLVVQAVPTVPVMPTPVAADVVPAKMENANTGAAGANKTNESGAVGFGGVGGLRMPPLSVIPSGGMPRLDFAPVKEPVESPAPVATPGGGSVPQPKENGGSAASATGAVAGGGKEYVNPIENTPIRKSDAASTSDAGTDKSAESGLKMPSGVMSILQVGGALTVVIGLILIGRALVRRFVPGARTGNGKGVVEILARHPLAKNQSIVLVRIGSQIVALNQRKDSSASILVISDPEEVARVIGQIEGTKPTSSAAGFNKLLANARVDLERGDEDGEPELRGMEPEKLDEQLEEMASAKRQLMELRQHVRTVRDKLPRT